MTYDEIRTAFSRRSIARQEARQFREQRLARLARGETLRPVRSGPTCAIHIVPLSPDADINGLDIRATRTRWNRFCSPYWGGGSPIFNLDGLLIVPSTVSSDPLESYVQIYRSGEIEQLSAIGHGYEEYADVIPATTLCDAIRHAVITALSEYREQGVIGEVMVGVSLLSVSGFKLGIGRSYHPFSRPIADRPFMALPEIVLDRYEGVASEEALREIFDLIWQSFGIERCTYYDKDGQWRPPN